MATLELGVQSPPSEISDMKKRVLSEGTKTYKIPPSLGWWEKPWLGNLAPNAWPPEMAWQIWESLVRK